MKTQTKAYCFAILTVLLWSTVSTAFKLALFHASSLQVLSYAMLIASAVLFIFILLSKEYTKIHKFNISSIKNIIFQTIILYFYHIVLFLGYSGLPVQIALPINYFWTILLAIFGVFFLQQKMSLKEIFWLFFAFSGIILISLGTKHQTSKIELIYLLYIGLSPILYALYWIFTTKDTLPPITKLFFCFFLCSICGFLNAYIIDETIIIPEKAIYPIIYIGLFELSIPFILWFYAMQYTDSIAKIATIPLCSPFLSLLWAYLILNEKIHLINIIGLLIIILGTIMQQKIKTK